MVLTSFKRWIVRRLTRSSPEIRIEQARGLPSLFVRLPPELVQLILDHLPDFSISALALCSRELLVTVGLRCISPESVGAPWGQWTALVGLLRRDLPDHIFCTHCRKLHPKQHLAELKRSPWYEDSRGGIWVPKCAKEDHYRRAFIYFYPRFSFDRVQMALQHARYRLDWRQYIDDVAYSEAELEDDISAIYRQGRNNWFLFKHYIVDGEMYIRGQQWFLVPTTEMRNLLPMPRFGNVCGHLGGTIYYADNNLLRKALRCKFKHMVQGKPPCYSCQKDLISCKYCPTEACVDIKLFPDRTALVVTKWMRIGPGVSRDDTDWRKILRRAESHELDRERAHLARLSIAEALAVRDRAFGYGNGYSWHKKGSIRAKCRADDVDARSRLSLAPKHERQLLEMILPDPLMLG